NGASCDLDPVFNRILRPVDAGKRRQQAVVNIHDAAGKRVEHHGRQQAHEARQCNKFDRVIAQRGEDSAVEVLARRKLAMVDDRRLDSAAAGALETLRVGAIGYDEADFGLEIAAQNRVDDSLQIGAGTGNQDAEFDRRIFRHRISRGSANRHSALAARYFADNIGRQFAAAQMSDDAISLTRRRDRDHPQAVIEGAIHLGLSNFAEALNQAENRGSRPTAPLDDCTGVRGHYARHVFEHAAAGDIRKAVYFESLEQLDDNFRVDDRGTEEFLAERAFELVDVRAEPEFCMSQNAAHQ